MRDIVACVERLRGRYDVRALFCHAGHPSPHGLVGAIVGAAAAQLGLRHTAARAIELANNKFLCRQALAAAGVRTVAAGIADDAQSLAAEADRIGYPVIFKPPFGAGCAYVRRCLDGADVASHYVRTVGRYEDGGAPVVFSGHRHEFIDVHGRERRYVPGRTFQVERYIAGPEGSVECAVIGNRVLPLIVQDKLKVTEQATTVFEDLLITPPITFDAEQTREIRRYAVDAISALGLTDCLVHLEFRYEQGVGPQVLEINPRLGGMYVDEAFRTLLGVDPYGLYLDILTGNADADALAVAEALLEETPEQYHTMFVIYPPKSGTVRVLEGLRDIEALPGMIQVRQTCNPGGKVCIEDDEQHVAKFWGVGKRPKDVLALYEKACAMLRIEVE